MSDPRALLDDIEATIADAADERTVEEIRASNWYAARPINALRAVLDLHPADIHECVANDGRETYTAYEPECPTRRAITAALEAK